MRIICRHLMIRGKVQGVYYRATARNEAIAHGLDGWVRNRSDGCVEAVVRGPEVAVRAFIDWAFQGPPAARVEAVEVAEAEENSYDGFSMRSTE
ncbi:MAG: acylphosphatase [Rhodocyclaceae bacterium]|nr:acylphosphatase [Rhodocyclaceae bacterium]